MLGGSKWLSSSLINKCCYSDGQSRVNLPGFLLRDGFSYRPKINKIQINFIQTI